MQDHKIRVIGFVSDKEIPQNDSMVLEVPYFHYLIFTYRDTLFKLEIDSNGKRSYAFLACEKEKIDSLERMLEWHNKTTLKQRSELQDPGSRSCGPLGYTMTYKPDGTQFNLFSSGEFYHWTEYAWYDEIKLSRNQFPEIAQRILDNLERKMLNYYFSDAYIYKDLRFHYKHKLFPGFSDAGK